MGTQLDENSFGRLLDIIHMKYLLIALQNIFLINAYSINLQIKWTVQWPTPLSPSFTECLQECRKIDCDLERLVVYKDHFRFSKVAPCI